MAHPSSSGSLRCRRSPLLLALVCGAIAAQADPSAPAPGTAAPAGGRHLIPEIKVISRPTGTAADRYKHVDAVIWASGLRYETHSPGPVVAGAPEKAWPRLNAVHQAKPNPAPSTD